jgi:hypothetical protein
MRACDFADVVPNNLNEILFDPPYSNRQVKECYESIGLSFTQEDSQALFHKEKSLFASKVKQGGVVICFGWNSNGFGLNKGFEMIEVLLCPHGGAHHDTIVTVERKVTQDLFGR